MYRFLMVTPFQMNFATYNSITMVTRCLHIRVIIIMQNKNAIPQIPNQTTPRSCSKWKEKKRSGMKYLKLYNKEYLFVYYYR